MKKIRKTSDEKRSIIRGSVDMFLENLSLLVDGIASIFGENCEVVLHDLRHPEHSIYSIANARITGRRIGGPIIGGPIDDKGLEIIMNRAKREDIVTNYATRTKGGRSLKSTSVIFRDFKRKPVVALCINFDITEFKRAKGLLDTICMTEKKSRIEISETQQFTTKGNEINAIIAGLVNDAIAGAPTPISGAKKAEKIKAINTMHERGLFLLRGGVDYAANLLGVSRFTIYNYLKECQYRH